MYAPDRWQDMHWMRRAIRLAEMCPPAAGAYSVGALIIDADGVEIAAGYSREADPHEHAEEAALGKLLVDDARLAGATIYSTLEPCSQRHSPRTPCAQRILAAGIPRVVIAWREPSLFVDDCVGYEQLVEAGVVVVELHELAAAAKEVNVHLGGLA
ncbi:deaminase (plasmid) [Streptomyces sp. NBC_01178]|uniref:deaminase n=1 Tax=Streptomyces sp. NBC_01178 TaxID=2903762 RepID=UPI002F918204|nr:deaminase [Streptomyces sp. NBC_01178]